MVVISGGLDGLDFCSVLPMQNPAQFRNHSGGQGFLVAKKTVKNMSPNRSFGMVEISILAKFLVQKINIINKLRGTKRANSSPSKSLT